MKNSVGNNKWKQPDFSCRKKKRLQKKNQHSRGMEIKRGRIEIRKKLKDVCMIP